MKGKTKRSNIRYRISFFCILALFFVAGCGEGGKPAPGPQRGRLIPKERKKVEPIKPMGEKEAEKSVQTGTAVAPALDSEKGRTEYAYDPAGKPDPFKPFIQLSPGNKSLRSAPLTPLQKYELSQLKLVAIISTPEGNVAMVEDSAGKGYFLKKGTEIGKNEGRVVRILKDRVVIEEKFQDIFGKMKPNETSLQLHLIEGGEEP